MILLRVTNGYIFTGIKNGDGYQIQEDQPVVISESTASTGFPKRKLGKNKVTSIVLTFACANEDEMAANLAAFDTPDNGQLQFDYYSPKYQTIRRAYFTVYVDQVTVLSAINKTYGTWKVTLDQANIVAEATPVVTTISAFPTSYVSAHWSNPTDAYADDSAYAWTHGIQNADDDIVFGGFALPAIPADAVINSVTVEMNYRVSNTSSAAVISLQALHGAVEMGDGWSSTAEPSSWTKISPPYSGDWTVGQLNDGTLKARIRVHRTGSSATPFYELDYVKVSVKYTVEVA